MNGREHINGESIEADSATTQKRINAILLESKFPDIKGLMNMPQDIIISTITAICSINTDIYVGNIGKYLELSLDFIVGIKYGYEDNPLTNRSLIPVKKNKKAKLLSELENQKNSSNNNNNIMAPKSDIIEVDKTFFNQVSIKLKMRDSMNKEKNIDVKLFINGSIQMTGITSANLAFETLNKLFIKLNKIKATYDFKTRKIKERPYVMNYDVLKIESVNNFTVEMVNSDFDIGFKIDRNKLYTLLVGDKIECSYDPILHAGVNIKYYVKEKVVSIFVFESGSIIITGGQTSDQIVEAYNFVNRYLLINYRNLIINDILNDTKILNLLR